MTAEVVVMNRGGVALAADSAVTIEVGDSSKVRDSALKVFMLSKYRPVGVMVYANPSLLGVPWETIIKLFREQLGRRHCDKLIDYGEELINFLDKNDTLFPEDVQDRYYMRALKNEYRRIENRARRELADRRVHEIGASPAAQRKDKECVEQEIRLAEQSWAEEEEATYFLEGRASEETAIEVAGRNSGGVSEQIQQVFGNWGIEEEDRRRLLQIAKHLVTKDRLPNDFLSGLVIAGFGKTEHFPSVQHVEIGGVYGGKLKVRPREVKKVSEENPSHVMSFAYTEMVDSFLYGISQRVLGQIQAAATLIRELPVLALDAVPSLAAEEKSALADTVRRASEKSAVEFAEILLEESIDSRVEIETAIQALTITELAQVASTLVSLSSFQQQMSLGRQTVGGPVDVAVISKGDGFIWIDRKHYFRPELNNHFFQNYYGSSTEDDIGKSEDQGG